MSAGYSQQLTIACKWTANSAAQIAIGFANSIAICSAPFAAIDAGVMSKRGRSY